MNPAFLANAGSGGGGGGILQPKSQTIADKCRSRSILSLFFSSLALLCVDNWWRRSGIRVSSQKNQE